MKKFFKKIVLFVLVFLVTLFFIGSCTERPEEYKPKVESGIPVYTELTPDEYQTQMDELVKQPPTLKKSCWSLQAYAVTSEELIDKWYTETGVYPVADFLSGWFDYIRDPDGGYFDDNPAYPVKSEEPKESVTIPYQYEFYGKKRVVYKNGTYEIITCKVVTNDARSSGKTGAVLFTRENNLHQMTRFSFDIRLTGFTKVFDSRYAFRANFVGLSGGYSSGLTSDFISNNLTKLHQVYFTGSSENKLFQTILNRTDAVTIAEICGSDTSSTIQYFTISTITSSDYEFSQTVTNYYGDHNYWSFPTIYYDMHSGDTVTKNNVTNYSSYGYYYNDTTDSIDFDPSAFAGFFEEIISPLVLSTFNSFFSSFPGVGAVFPDTGGERNDLVTPSEPTTTSTGTYPVSTGDISVNVDVTFPEEFYRKYPALTTEPAFVAESPDFDFALDSPLPVRALETAGGLITLASDFIDDAGLMPVALMSVALGLAVMFFL